MLLLPSARFAAELPRRRPQPGASPGRERMVAGTRAAGPARALCSLIGLAREGSFAAQRGGQSPATVVATGPAGGRARRGRGRPGGAFSARRGGAAPSPYWPLGGVSPALIGCRRGRGVSRPPALPRLH